MVRNASGLSKGDVAMVAVITIAQLKATGPTGRNLQFLRRHISPYMSKAFDSNGARLCIFIPNRELQRMPIDLRQSLMVKFKEVDANFYKTHAWYGDEDHKVSDEDLDAAIGNELPDEQRMHWKHQEDTQTPEVTGHR